MPSKRLASLFSSFANKYELSHTVEPDNSGGVLGIPYDRKIIHANYSFISDDSYENMAALHKVERNRVRGISAKIMRSQPTRGATERITSSGKIISLIARDNLETLPDADVHRNFMDDVAKITDVYDSIKKMMGTNENQVLNTRKRRLSK